VSRANPLAGEIAPLWSGSATRAGSRVGPLHPALGSPEPRPRRALVAALHSLHATRCTAMRCNARAEGGLQPCNAATEPSGRPPQVGTRSDPSPRTVHSVLPRARRSRVGWRQPHPVWPAAPVGSHRPGTTEAIGQLENSRTRENGADRQPGSAVVGHRPPVDNSRADLPSRTAPPNLSLILIGVPTGTTPQSRTISRASGLWVPRWRVGLVYRRPASRRNGPRSGSVR
jgi:hypothetical protein